jgi:outer membrane murein-binding lipoprotein Lpp
MTIRLALVAVIVAVVIVAGCDTIRLNRAAREKVGFGP